MTTITVWKNRENDIESIWAVADSRITGLNNHKLADSVDKIHKIPLCIHEPGKVYPNNIFEGGFILNPEVHSIGATFAGSTFIAQNSIFKIKTLVSMLQPKGGSEFYISSLPSMERISELLKTVGQEYLSSLCDYAFKTKLDKKSVITEICIFGYCGKSNKLECYSINNRFSIKEFEIEKINLDTLSHYTFGDKCEEISQRISVEYKKHKKNSIEWHRSPYLAVKEVILSEDNKTIGGDMTIMSAHKYGAHFSYVVDKRGLGNHIYDMESFFTSPMKFYW